jgi:amino acid transporter
MENNEFLDDVKINEITGSGMSEVTKNRLLQTAKWAKFFGNSSYVVGLWYIYSGIKSIIAPTIANLEDFGTRQGLAKGMIWGSVIFTFISAALSFFLGSLFLKFSKRAEAYFWNQRGEDLTESFKSLSVIMKYYGIMSIVFTVLVICVFFYTIVVMAPGLR